MVWVKIDDGAMLHPKQMQAGIAACGLWLAGLCYANRHATDGALPGDLRLVCPWEKKHTLDRLAKRLVDVGLWATNEAKKVSDRDPIVIESFSICNYIVFQSQATRDSQTQRREAEKLRQQRFREKTKPVTEASRRDKSVVTVASQHPDPDPIPTRSKRSDPGAAREEKSEPSEPEKITEQIVAGIYANMFNAKCPEAGPFMRAASYSRDFQVIAASCKTRTDVEIGVRNFFASEDRAIREKDYPPTFLARDWSVWRHPPHTRKNTAKPEDFANDQDPSKWVFDRNNPPPAAHVRKRLWWSNENNKRIKGAA